MDKLGVWHHLNGCEKSDFLFPVHGMSDKFRGRFMALLTRRLKEDGIVIANYIRKQCFDKDWVVYSRPPAKGVNLVLEYIARYAYRVAITNSRILDVTDNSISYDYKDYRKGGKHKVMEMGIDKFLGLLSLHVLPDRFVRIRHYGILSPCNRDALRHIQKQLDVPLCALTRRKTLYIVSFVA